MFKRNGGFLRSFSFKSSPQVDNSMQTNPVPIVVDGHSSTESLSTTPASSPPDLAIYEMATVCEDLETDDDLDIDMNLKIENDFLSRVIRDQFVCSICRNLLIKTHTLNCGHNFCFFCINQWQKRCFDCPLCRERVSMCVPSNNTDQFLRDIVNEFGSDAMKQKYEIKMNESRVAMESRRTVDEESSNLDLGVQVGRYIQTFSSYTDAAT